MRLKREAAGCGAVSKTRRARTGADLRLEDRDYAHPAELEFRSDSGKRATGSCHAWRELLPQSRESLYGCRYVSARSDSGVCVKVRILEPQQGISHEQTGPAQALVVGVRTYRHPPSRAADRRSPIVRWRSMVGDRRDQDRGKSDRRGDSSKRSKAQSWSIRSAKVEEGKDDLFSAGKDKSRQQMRNRLWHVPDRSNIGEGAHWSNSVHDEIQTPGFEWVVNSNRKHAMWAHSPVKTTAHAQYHEHSPRLSHSQVRGIS